MRLLLVILILLPAFLNAQINTTEGKITESINNSQIKELIEKHIAYNDAVPGISGFRVQIFFNSGNNSKEDALKKKTEFVTKYPEINAYLMWHQPYYKLRVGDFRTKIEAQGFLNKINEDFKNSFIVKDRIALPSIEKSE